MPIRPRHVLADLDPTKTFLYRVVPHNIDAPLEIRVTEVASITPKRITFVGTDYCGRQYIHADTRTRDGYGLTPEEALTLFQRDAQKVLVLAERALALAQSRIALSASLDLPSTNVIILNEDW
jgi:hypothetical protein